ncbi:MAG: mechanosensitive ion channel family protein [Zetaproteobacteria bacterium]|nr:mechanosensitive ion channel family protein [Zetaproteobacteria bacterium]
MEQLLIFIESHREMAIALGKDLSIAVMVVVMTLLVARGMKRVMLRATSDVKLMDPTIISVFANILTYLIYILGLLIVLDLFGVNTTSVIALLGAAGLAVGLALKDTLSNIAAGIVLLFLRPFKVGDFIECGSVIGNVREIGLFTTILETADGLYISAPNGALWGEPIKNFTRNGKRRIDLTVGIDYGDSIETGLLVLKRLAESDAEVLNDPAPKVFVFAMADSCVNLQLRAWVKVEAYGDTVWRLTQGAKEQIEAAGLHIPFPQQVVTFVEPGKSLLDIPKK